METLSQRVLSSGQSPDPSLSWQVPGGAASCTEQGQLEFSHSIGELEDDAVFNRWLSDLYRKNWVVYAKRPFGGPSHVLRYLARYTHRTAISNHRLLSMSEGKVSFLWKDYAHGCKRKVMSLAGTEFLRRFLMHTLPKGFVRIRHYGFLANRHRVDKLGLSRELLESSSVPQDLPEPATVNAAAAIFPCSRCDGGTMQLVYRIEAREILRALQNLHHQTVPP